jgi:FkbM family methyltransferase
MKQRLLFIAPHLSTGGMPQYLYKQIVALLEDFDVYCIEWDNVTGGVLVVQRNRILEALGDRLITLGEDKTELLNYVNNKIKPDIVHLQEIPEMFMGYGIAEKLYATDRKYRIVETSHDSSYDVTKKSHFPDKFMMVSQYQVEAYKILNIPCELVEYPIEDKTRTKTREELMSELGLDPNKKHVITVGLFTPRKNQAEVVEYARILQDQPIQFHFIGNQADNFKYYWEPIMKDFPSNCTWWGERSDVDTFYQMADLFLFTSRGFATDKETMPLVIREAISWKVPSLIYNLDVYLHYFNKYGNIGYLNTSDKIDNILKILNKLELDKLEVKENNMFYTLEGEKDLASYEYPNSMYESMIKYGDAAGIYWATYLYHELCRFDVCVEEGDVFVDLGTNIGISSKYALLHGAKEVHCFEPDPVLIELIKKNVPSSEIYQYAIDSKSEEFELYHWPYNPVNEGPKYKCKSVTLREVLSLVNKPIDYLKIDIEGFEHNIFDDLTYEECSKFKKLFVEHHMPEKTNDFCEVLKSKGYNLSVEYGNGQNYIYAKHENPYYTDKKQNKDQILKKINMDNKQPSYNFWSKWDKDEQQMHFGAYENVNEPLIVSLREYMSDGVLWSCDYDYMPKDVAFWMIPVSKGLFDYEKDINYAGIKICIYKKKDGKKVYEQPYFSKFVDVPRVTLSNSIPYYLNYTEFFIHDKYARYFRKKYHNVVDVGANVGVFTEYLIQNEHTEKVIAVECDSKALYDLTRNFKREYRVEIEPKALYHENTKITFYHSEENPVISSTIAPDKLVNHMAGVKGQDVVEVETITIRDLVNKLGYIDLLKIDIEGGEYEVIENLDPHLFNHINNFLIECHFFESDYKVKYDNLIDKLRNGGYIVEEFLKDQSSNSGTSEVIFASKI